MGVKRFGDWDKVKQKLNRTTGHRLATALHQATIKNALILVREIKKGIQSQAPGGKPFAKLAESTIQKKGSSKALIDTGFLINAITQRIMKDKAFVGLMRGTTNQKGDDLVNIGAVMEYGATIRQANGSTIIIPPRPFLNPTMEQYRDEIVKNYKMAIQTVI